MNDMGHNSNAMRLAELAKAAADGLVVVSTGEADAVQGWLAYGAALNEGRALFHEDDDKGFGQWVAGNLLSQLATVDPSRDERAAAMWADANRTIFATMYAAGKARTVRGVHAKWKEAEAKREADEQRAREAEEAKQRKAEAEAAKADMQAKVDADERARREAAAARNDEERKAADERAKVAAEALAAAEEAAKVAEQAVAEVQEEPDPETKKLRTEYRKLTDEAREEEWIAFRAEIAERKAEAKAQREAMGDLQARLKELTADNQGRTIGKLQREVNSINGRMAEIITERARADRYIKVLKAENEALKKELENQVIPL